MKCDVLTSAAMLSNGELVARLQFLAGRAREDTVAMVAHLAELEARGIHLAEGYGSLFVYCTAALRLSEHEAYNRALAARLVRPFPLILEGLADGSLNLTTLRLLAPLMTAENHGDLLSRAAGRSKREVAMLAASLAPRPDVPASVRLLPGTDHGGSLDGALQPPPRSAEGSATVDVETQRPVRATQGTSADPSTPMAARLLSHSPHPRAALLPLSPARYRLQCTIGEEAHGNLPLVQELLRKEIPSGDAGLIVERALTLLAAQVLKDKAAATTAPRVANPATPGSRHVPAAVRRAVWLRDRGQCAFVGKPGRRCTERAFLELHHRVPFALEGEATVDNMSLRCSRHNAYEAQLDFGIRSTPGPVRRDNRKGPATLRVDHDRTAAPTGQAEINGSSAPPG